MQFVSPSIAIGIALWAGFARADDNARPVSNDLKSIQGIWSGSWGGGDRGGVVFQPVLAEMVIHGEEVELTGFRNAAHLRGTVRIDPATKRLWFKPRLQE